MHEPLVTVVIPVYKTEAFLDRCISSVAGQSYEGLEILLIDDGSPDNCPRLCDAWAEKDSRIRVIHKENQGLGMARNTGMAQARGKYLCFVDSDDALEQTAIEAAAALAQRTQAEIVLYGMTCLDAAGAVTARRIPAIQKAVFSGREVQEALLPRLLSGENGLTMSACCCLISAELVQTKRWQFPSEREIISEDVYALLGLFCHVQRAAVLTDAPYRYYENAQSLTHTYRADRFEKIKAFYRACLSLCESCGYSREVRNRCAVPFLSYAIAAMKLETARHGVGVLPRLKEIMADELLHQALREADHENTGWKRTLFLRCIRRRRYRLALLLLSAQNRTQ